MFILIYFENLFILIGTICLVSCSGKFQIQNKINSKYNYRVIKNDFAKYSVHLEHKSGHSFTINKINKKLNVSSTIKEGVSSYTDDSLYNGDNLTYELIDESLNEKEILNIEIPLDLKLHELNLDTLPEHTIIKELKKVKIKLGEVIFINPSYFYIENRNIDLYTDKIKFNRTIVGTNFKEIHDKYEKPPSGGVLNLFSDFVEGDVKIKINGIDAKEFEDLEMSPHSSPAKDGIKGYDGITNLYFEDQKSNEPYKIECINNPGNGFNGFDGKEKGWDGLDGINGGDAGNINFFFKKTNNFQFNVESKYGKASKPKKGGLGQKGGQGGEPGAEIVNMYFMNPEKILFKTQKFKLPEYCKAEWGKIGLNAPTGENGKPGSDGKYGKFCYQLNINEKLVCNEGDIYENK